MSVAFSSVKCIVFGFNLICLGLGIGAIAVSSIGLENARPETVEHTYFIIGIILGSLLCMTTIFGCYGVICELMGVCLVYSLFLLMLLVIQLLQMHNHQPQSFVTNALDNLQSAWELVEVKPQHMQRWERKYECCALYNSHDYAYKGLIAPSSCYLNEDILVADNLFANGCLDSLQLAYQTSAEREQYLNWALVIAEGISLCYSLILSLILYRRDRMERTSFQPIRGYTEPHTNHVGSRVNLLSNEF